MSLLDFSLLALLAVPWIFFMCVAYGYCRHARNIVRRLRDLNSRLAVKIKELNVACTTLQRDNTELRGRLVSYANSQIKDKFGIG